MIQPSSTSSSTSSRAVRAIQLLLVAYSLVSLASIGVLIVQGAQGLTVNGAEWVRCSIVLASSIVMVLISLAAARGNRAAFIRLRIISPIVLAALVVIASIPGFLPPWLRIEQSLCAVILVPVVVLLFRRGSAALFGVRARA